MSYGPHIKMKFLVPLLLGDFNSFLIPPRMVKHKNIQLFHIFVLSQQETGEETQWHIQTESLSSMSALIDAIQSPWQQLFGVAMPQTMHPSITLQVRIEQRYKKGRLRTQF